jgi:regulator of replication initiation timing
MSTLPATPGAAEETPLPEVGVRYQQLEELVRKALTNSRRAIDCKQAIVECYDKTIGEDQTTKLVEILDTVLQQVQEKTEEEMMLYFEKENIRDTLERVERIARKLEQEEREKIRRDRLDAQSAKEAIESARLPTDVTTQDVMAFQTFQKMLEEKAALESAIAEVQQETSALKGQHENCTQNIKENIQQVVGVKDQLDRSADACSMVS